MIRFKLKELLSRFEFLQNRRVTLSEVAEATGIHRVTLSKIANERGYNAGIDNVNRLCAFFQCQPNDLMEYLQHADDLPKGITKVNQSTGGEENNTVPKPSQNRPRTVPKR